MKRLSVLLLAEAANPETASVPLVGWSHAEALARNCDAHLVTQVRNREAVQRQGWRVGEDFTAIDTESVARPLWHLSRLLRGRGGGGWTVATAFSAIRNYEFERKVWLEFGEQLGKGRFDLVHRITPVSPTVPSLIARRLRNVGVPLVIGPMNGGLPWPKGHGATLRAESEWLSHVRQAHTLLPGYRSTRCDASALLIGSRATWQQVPERYRAKCFYLPENAVDLARFDAQRTRRAKLPIRCVFLGRLVPYKCPDLLLEAAAPLIRAGRLQLSFIGDGPLMPRLRELVEREQLDSVKFTGWVEHHLVQHELAKADLLAVPSIREFGGGVVLEAMAVGLAPLVVTYGGPGELITPLTGIGIPLGSRAEIQASLGQALSTLIDDPGRLDEMGRVARAEVSRLFTWDAKSTQVESVYRWLVRGGPRPPRNLLHVLETARVSVNDDKGLIPEAQVPR